MRKARRRPSDGILVDVEWRGWLLSLFASVIALLFGNFSAALGLLLGGALAMLNFRGITIYFGRVLRKGRRPPWWMHGFYWAKFGLMALILAGAFRLWEPHPIGVIGGFSVLVIALIWSGLRAPRNVQDKWVSSTEV